MRSLQLSGAIHRDGAGKTSQNQKKHNRKVIRENILTL
jgi:hypothetical protein